ncbi:hypothetical protein ABIB00_007823 [Bradyrhizobium sp. LB14.3]
MPAARITTRQEELAELAGEMSEVKLLAAFATKGYAEEDRLAGIIRAINDCHAVFAANIGGCPTDILINAWIEPVDQYAHDAIEKSAIGWFRGYLHKTKNGDIPRAKRGDAAIPQEPLISVA